MLHEGLGSAGLWGDFPGKASGRDRRRRVRLFARRLWRLDAGETAAPARLHARRGARRVAEAARRKSAFAAGCCSAIPTAPRSRRSMPARIRIIACEGMALIAPHFIVEDISVTSIAEIKTAYETTEPEGETRALAQRRRQRLLWLERRLARSEIPRLGYFRISRLYPRAGRDRAGRGRSIRHHAADRDRAGGVLLPGRCDRHRRRRPFAASRGAGGDA